MTKNCLEYLFDMDINTALELDHFSAVSCDLEKC